MVKNNQFFHVEWFVNNTCMQMSIESNDFRYVIDKIKKSRLPRGIITFVDFSNEKLKVYQIANIFMGKVIRVVSSDVDMVKRLGVSGL